MKRDKIYNKDLISANPNTQRIVKLKAYSYRKRNSVDKFLDI